MRGGRFFLPLVLTLALLVNMVPALPAQAATPVSDSASDEFVVYDFVSAQVKAKALHHRILLVSALTEVSTTWVNVDGTSTVDVSGSPVRVHDASGLYGWRDLDFDLVATDSGVVAKSVLLPLTLSPGGTDANGQTDTRANPTTLTVGGETYQAAYDNFGATTKQTAPAGLTQEFSYDENGRLTGMNYGGSDANGNPTAQPWYNFARTFNENSLLATETKPTSSPDSATATTSYSYDTKNRLTNATTINAAGTTCSTNTYSFDFVGNRTNKTTTSGTAANCVATTQTKSTTYNSYSQISDTGYVYDGFGRNTVIPAANTPTGATTSGTPDLTLSYNLVGQVTTINGVTASSYGYDPNGNNLTETTTTAGVTTTTTKHYFGSDTPSFTTSTTGGVTTTEKYSPSLGSGLQSITTTTNGVTTTNYVYTDLQGANFAATTKPTTGYATPPAGINTFDEYGNQTAGNQTIGTNQNYGWAGSAHRTTDKNGIILLGARVYNPATGQFTTTDPVPGGNENGYNYPNNPVNQNDFTGCWGSFGDWLDVGLTVAMVAIDCVPVVGEVAMAVETGYAIYKAARIAKVVVKEAVQISESVAKSSARQAIKDLGHEVSSHAELKAKGVKQIAYIITKGEKNYVGMSWKQGIKRIMQHLNTKRGFTVSELNDALAVDASNLSKHELRELEQNLMNTLKNKGIKLLNKNNSIAESKWDPDKIVALLNR